MSARCLAQSQRRTGQPARPQQSVGACDLDEACAWRRMAALNGEKSRALTKDMPAKEVVLLEPPCWRCQHHREGALLPCGCTAQSRHLRARTSTIVAMDARHV